MRRSRSSVASPNTARVLAASVQTGCGRFAAEHGCVCLDCMDSPGGRERDLCLRGCIPGEQFTGALAVAPTSQELRLSPTADAEIAVAGEGKQVHAAPCPQGRVGEGCTLCLPGFTGADCQPMPLQGWGSSASAVIVNRRSVQQMNPNRWAARLAPLPHASRPRSRSCARTRPTQRPSLRRCFTVARHPATGT